MCTFIFQINTGTKYIRSKVIRKAKGVVAKGKDLYALRNDVRAIKSALRILKIPYDNKKWELKEVIIEKYLSQSFVDE